MKILHIASFCGNVGDVLSNRGLHDFLKRRVEARVLVDRVEIRRFYKNAPTSEALSFDEIINQHQNRYDRIIIGGGGFLDYSIVGSTTGATIEISPRTLDTLRTRLVISSVGAYPHHPVPDENMERFPRFLQQLAETPNVRLMLRNDGSQENIRRTFGDALADRLHTAGDHCYLMERNKAIETAAPSKYILVNIPHDQIKMQSMLRGVISRKQFQTEAAIGLMSLAESYDCKLMFVPHLIDDLRSIYAIVDHMPDSFVRSRVTVSAYDGSDDGIAALISNYKSSAFNVATRLHSNILSLVLGRPTVSMGVLDRVVAISEQHSHSILVKKLDESFARQIVIAAAECLTCVPDSSVEDICSRTEIFLADSLS